MPYGYAHVVVYVGLDEESKIHEVVHVSKNWECCSLMQSKICKQDVKIVINDEDKVLLGHELPGWQFSANAREAIKDRALKCAEKPTIKFDYDHE